MGWDVMRLHGINKCQCHSHPIGLGLFDSWGQPQVTVTDWLLGCDETLQDKSKGQMVTRMLFIMGHETYGDNKMVLSHILLVMGWDITSPLHRNGGWCDSHPVHGTRWHDTAWWNKRAGFAHWLLVGWDMSNMHSRNKGNPSLAVGHCWYVTILLVILLIDSEWWMVYSLI